MREESGLEYTCVCGRDAVLVVECCSQAVSKFGTRKVDLREFIMVLQRLAIGYCGKKNSDNVFSLVLIPHHNFHF